MAFEDLDVMAAAAEPGGQHLADRPVSHHDDVGHRFHDASSRSFGTRHGTDA